MKEKDGTTKYKNNRNKRANGQKKMDMTHSSQGQKKVYNKYMDKYRRSCIDTVC